MWPVLFFLAISAIPVTAYAAFRCGIKFGVEAGLKTMQQELEKRFTLVPKIRERV